MLLADWYNTVTSEVSWTSPNATDAGPQPETASTADGWADQWSVEQNEV